MIPIDATIRKWGNSFGITIPKDVAAKEHIKEKQRVKVLILKDGKNMRESFGTAKKILSKTAQELKDEARKELYDE
ncbi:MAG: AbrB/MazE/SpoVT family DNA-binding domain-containing protein [Methanobacteriota archaeon]